MPRIPTRDSLRQGVPRSTGGIVRAPRDFVGAGLASAGNQLSAVADVQLRKEKQQQSSLELAKARSEWNTALLVEQNSYNTQDIPDYGSWDKQYKYRAPILQNKAADNISDPVVRERFKLETNDDRVRVGLGINNDARRIATQARLTAADTSLDQLVGNAAQMDDEGAQGVFGDIKATLQDLVDTGVITKEEAANRSIKYARRFAVIRGKQLVDNDPAQARSVLSGEKASPASLIKQFEGFRSSPYWDVNAQRVGYGSDTITTASGQVIKVKPGITVSRADAERDLERRIGEFQSVIRGQVGDKKFEGLTPNVQAALTSMAYNYGSLPGSVAKAVKTGNVEKIADAIEARATDNDGVNQKRRLEEAAIVRGVDGNAYGRIAERPLWAGSLSPEQRLTLLDQANTEVRRIDSQSAVKDRVRAAELGGLIDSDLESIARTGEGVEGIEPGEVQAALGPVKFKQWQDGQRDAKDLYRATTDMPSLSNGELNARVAGLKPEAGAEDFEAQQELFNNAGKYAQRILKLRQDDPATAADMTLPENERLKQSFNPGQPATMAPIIARRMATQASLGILPENRKPLTNAEANAVGSSLREMDPEQKLAFSAELAQSVGGESLRRILQQFGTKGQAAQTEATIMSMASMGLEATARDAWRGQKAIADGLVSKLAGDDKTSAEEIENTQLAGVYDIETASARQVAIDIARDLYAAHAADKKLTAFDADAYRWVLQQAHGFDGKTGGLTKRNSSSFMLPVGVDDDTFNRAMDNLQADDLKGLSQTGEPPHHYSLAGKWIKADLDDVQDSHLVAVGQGLYKVSITNPMANQPQYLMDRTTGQAWVLNLSDNETVTGIADRKNQEVWQRRRY